MTRPSLSTASAGLSVWNGSRPGASKFSAPRCSEKLDAAVLHQHAGRAAARSRSRTPNRATGCRRRRGRWHRRRPSRRCRRRRAERPGRRLAAVDLHRLAGDEARLETALERVRQIVRIGDGAVAHPQRALGRLDQAVDMIEAFRLGHAQARKQGQDHQRGDALGRGVGVVERACRQFDAQRLGERRRDSASDRRASTGLPMRSRSAAISRPTSPR